MLGLSKLSSPTVWSPSRVMMAGELAAVSAPRKLAEALAELGMPPSQLFESFHEPPPSIFHCGGLLLRLRVATSVPERRRVLSPVVSVEEILLKRTGRVRVSMPLATTTFGVLGDWLKRSLPVKSLGSHWKPVFQSTLPLA